MFELELNVLRLYVPLVLWVGLGVILGRILPANIPYYLGKFLFWIGVPISIVTFLRQADLSGSVWIAPLIAWVAVLLGAGLGWLWLKGLFALSPTTQAKLPGWVQRLNNNLTRSLQPSPSQGSFILSSTLGNTGYLGYPITLALVGPQYFAWAIFYDTLGNTLGSYGFGVALAAHYGLSRRTSWQLMKAIAINPGILSFVVGLTLRPVFLPEPVEQVMRGAAWTILSLALLLIGMRLSQVKSWNYAQQATPSLGIKMILVPLLLGFGLPHLGITGPAQLVIVLQMAMPPAFATLVIAEAYELDRELTVTALAIGSVGILFTLPIWIGLFAP
jgi:predicted permease